MYIDTGHLGREKKIGPDVSTEYYKGEKLSIFFLSLLWGSDSCQLVFNTVFMNIPDMFRPYPDQPFFSLSWGKRQGVGRRRPLLTIADSCRGWTPLPWCWPQWGSHVISEKSTRVGPQLGRRRTESRHVATPSYWEQPSKGRTQDLHGNLLSSSVKCEQTAGWNLPQFSFSAHFSFHACWTPSPRLFQANSPCAAKATAQWTHGGFNFELRLSCLQHHWNFLRISS